MDMLLASLTAVGALLIPISVLYGINKISTQLDILIALMSKFNAEDTLDQIERELND